ncbi:MAG: biopolymer transporter ExbD, partial [Gammaproteobacteria bacterium]|nr:biopolymer transporter ExbD [Gammaproteobacteria bacterium]
MIRRRAPAEASVELTPLIDVVLLLLIFFMVSTSFVRESRLGIELPGAAGEPGGMEPAAVEVLVQRDGAYRVNGKPVAGNSLADLLAAIVEASEGSPAGAVGLVIAAAARSTPHAVVMGPDAAPPAGLPPGR